MGYFDQGARYAAQADPEAVIARLLRGSGTAFRFREWVETRTSPLPGDRDLTADCVAALTDPADPERPWLLLLEFQSQHDPEKLDVTLAEVARLRIEARHGDDRRGKYRVLAALVYLAGQCPEAVIDMTTGGHGTRHAPIVWNVESDSAAAALDTLAAGQTSWGILFWVPLMAGAEEPATIARWRELASTLAEKRWLGDLAKIALVFADLPNHYLVWEKGLEGWEVPESQVVNRWIEKAQLDTTREDLLRVLRSRFPDCVTDEVADAVNAQPSRAMLHDWMDIAASAASFETFLDALRGQ
jgi:hypothetical protein